jgi:surfeit locus 1 family protein
VTYWTLLRWPLLATLVALGILLSLGTWQLQRMHEKAAILKALDQAITATPKNIEPTKIAGLKISNAGGVTIAENQLPELTRITLKGSYISGRSVPVRATLPTPKNQRSLGGLGYFWMTPLQVENGPIIFINRGFVPTTADYKAPVIETPEGPQEITGLLRQPEKPQTFTPKDNSAKGEYFARDPKQLATYVALNEVADFYIDLERPSADDLRLPVGADAKEMITRIPNNHLQYAVTWYGFALTLLGVFGFFARGRILASQKSNGATAHHG